jgi:hypothetical protein
MDPISISLALTSALVMPLARQLIEKAVDPENVARGINWVLLAAEHFLKVRRNQASLDEPAPPLPSTKAEDEGVHKPSGPHVKSDMEDFTLNLLADQVESLMKLIEIYVGNLQHLLQQAAQYGGEELAPIHVVNQIRLQRKSISERLNELTEITNQVYDVRIKEVEKLTEVFNSK